MEKLTPAEMVECDIIRDAITRMQASGPMPRYLIRAELILLWHLWSVLGDEGQMHEMQNALIHFPATA